MAEHDVRRGTCRYSRIALRLGFAALCLLLVVPILLVSGCNSERPAVEPDVHSENGTVVLGGHLSRDTVEEGEALRFWISVENRSSMPIENVRIAGLDAPGFKKARWCWGPSAAAKGCTDAPNAMPQVVDPDCAPANEPSSTGSDEWLLCRSLKPGESLVVWGDLSVDDPYLPPERLTAVVNWTETLAGTKPSTEVSSKVVPLGTAEPVTPLHVLTWLTKPEVSIPGMLTVLGLYLAWQTKRRDERSKVFTAMLGAVHDAAIHYFMPMCSTLSAAMDYTGKAGKDAAPGENARRGFYYLTMFHWWQRRVLNKVGAYQLRSRTGEKLLYALSSRHRELFPRNTEAAWRRYDAILSDLEKETTLDEFLRALDDGDPDWTEAWNDFAAWVKTDDCKNDLSVLDAYYQVMLYEVNGLHELWYRTRSPMKLSDDTRVTIMEAATRQGSKFEAESYLQAAESNDTRLYLGV
jgi:hypothetical protein